MKKMILLLLMVSFSAGVVSAQQDIPEAPFGLSPAEVLSIFNGNISNRDYASALMFGRYLILAHPKDLPLPGNVPYRGDRTFDRMITAYTELAKAESDPIVRSALIDTAKSLYARVLDIFTPEEIDVYRWRFEYGRFFQMNQSIRDANMRATEQYLKLYELNPERLVKEANGYYIQFIISQIVGSGDRDRAIRLMAESEQYANPETVAYYASVRDRLFSNPAERIEYLETLPRTLENLTELFDLYTRTGNREMVAKLAVELYEMNPNFDNTMRMVNMASSNANYRRAIELLEEALTKATTTQQRRDVTMEISNNFLNLDNLQRARDFARRAIELDRNWGQPYLKIAEIYGQAVSNCAGGSMTRQDKVVYWLVLDYLDRARSTDSSTRQFVERQYPVYQAAMPTVEEKFYQNWIVGERIRVDGSLKECYAWINETTTIR